jgi:hypothetical protein
MVLDEFDERKGGIGEGVTPTLRDCTVAGTAAERSPCAGEGSRGPGSRDYSHPGKVKKTEKFT